ncbi:unnamed protein product [Darwinula stevensoni]|uniref:TIR domain-containing protein n=1 Tax=Darwinula stevensoni TaxID=69355 RepID=A0A7R8X343_9CRUS|nr:unnamed protein product [Darwinula stevensoni]CAG0881929.1 unnamed protein product [Darwinula stevensoni]
MKVCVSRHVMTVLFLLGQVFLQAFAQAAPRPSQGSCHTQKIADGTKLLCQNATQLPKPLPEGITIIHIMNSRLSRLEAEDLDSTTVETVKFEENVIEELDEGAFRLLPKLTFLHLSKNVIQGNVTWCNFLNLNNLTNLHMEDNQLGIDSFFTLLELENGTSGVQNSGDFCRCRVNTIINVSSPHSPCEQLEILPNLKVLRLSGNPIKILPGDIFLPLRRSPLLNLFLENCQLRYIDKDTFAPLKSLQKLSLKNNVYLKMEYLARTMATISSKSNLSLDLSLNELKEVPKDVLTPLKATLMQLYLSGSNLENISSFSFPHLPVLDVLDLSMSRIRTIETGAFNRLPSLRVLDLSGNVLTQVPTATMLPTLIILTLNNNPYYDSAESMERTDDDGLIIPPFEDMDQLLTLSLSGSTVKTQSITRATFTGLKNLKRLDINNCKLKSIESLTFSALESLEHLDLSGNEINIDNDEILSGLTSLISIFLHGNEITFRGATSPFKDLKNLKVLKLSDNFIRYLTGDLLLGLEKIETLILSENNILAWKLPIFATSTNLNTLRLDRNNLVEVTEGMLIDFSNLTTLDISKNLFECDCGLCDFYRWAMGNHTTLDNWEKEGAYTCRAKNGTEYSLLHDGDKLFQDCRIGGNTQPDTKSNVLGLAIGLSVFVITLSVLGYFAYRRWWYVKYLYFRARSRRKSKSSEQSYDYDAYVCFSDQDQTWVLEKLVKNLEEEGSDVHLCIHFRDFQVGASVTTNIVAAIARSRKMLFVISKHFLKSSWCLYELDAAQHQLLEDKRDGIVLVLLEDMDKSSTPKDLRYLMRTRTHIKWPSDRPEEEKLFWARLKKAILVGDNQ